MKTLKNAASGEARTSAAEVEELARRLERWASDLEIQALVAARHRRKAAEVRDASKTARDPVVRELLLILAADYERFAERADCYQSSARESTARVA
ncbi:MAG: hypothetical protein ACLQJR_05380 [Stellaceae bacterium]